MKTIITLALMTLAAGIASADLIEYEISGTLVEGGILTGSFTLDSDAPDLEPAEGRGKFEIVDFDLSLVGTTLFMSGGNTSTSGAGNAMQLFQDEAASNAFLSFDLISDSGMSGAFGGIDFEPFVGDADQLQFLDTASIVGGLVDGSGESTFTDFSLVVVPEPHSAVLFCIAMMCALIRRSRRTTC